jgi:GT2 family glycosyltransferase
MPDAAPISLGLCTFNRGPAISRTLDAIAAMTRTDRLAEFIVIDNNCTDQTPALIDAFGAAHPELRVRRIVETTQGIGAARARFFRDARSPLLAMLDDDCLPDPTWLAAMLAALDPHPTAGWIGGRIDLEWESDPTPLARRCATMLAQQHLGDTERVLDKPDQGMASAAFAARRAALDAIGWLDSRLLGGREGASLESGEDYEICIRMRRAGFPIIYAPDARVRHLIPDRRQSIDYLERLARGVSLSKAQLKWLAEGEPGIDWAREHLDKARSRRARSRLLEWRPGIRRLKLAEHDGRVESWERLVRMLTTGAHAPSAT